MTLSTILIEKYSIKVLRSILQQTLVLSDEKKNRLQGENKTNNKGNSIPVGVSFVDG